MQKNHITNIDRPIAYYSLDVIISVGYLVKSKLYLIGASLKDLGKKWFRFSLIEDENILYDILKRIEK